MMYEPQATLNKVTCQIMYSVVCIKVIRFSNICLQQTYSTKIQSLVMKYNSPGATCVASISLLISLTAVNIRRTLFSRHCQ